MFAQPPLLAIAKYCSFSNICPGKKKKVALPSFFLNLWVVSHQISMQSDVNCHTLKIMCRKWVSAEMFLQTREYQFLQFTAFFKPNSLAQAWKTLNKLCLLSLKGWVPMNCQVSCNHTTEGLGCWWGNDCERNRLKILWWKHLLSEKVGRDVVQ